MPGDRVLTKGPSGLEYSTVELFAHADGGAAATFSRLSTASGRALEVTRGHYVPTRRGVVEAKDAVVGDEVEVLDTNGTLAYSAIVRVESLRRPGLFAPLTKRGLVVVDGIVASEYSRGLLGGVLGKRAPKDAQALYETVAHYALALLPTRVVRAAGAAATRGGFAMASPTAFFRALAVSPY